MAGLTNKILDHLNRGWKVRRQALERRLRKDQGKSFKTALKKESENTPFALDEWGLEVIRSALGVFKDTPASYGKIRKITMRTLTAATTNKACIFPLMLLCLFAVCGCAVRTTPPPGTILEGQAVRDALQHGDWLVTRGIGSTDNAVVALTNMALSHAAIYDAEQGEVIEADSKGVHATPVDEFLAKSQRVMVLQPRWATSLNRGEAVRLARGHIGKGYNYTGLIGVNSPERYYCTQLVVAAYRPFMEGDETANPIPPVIRPGQMFHWGRIVYDSGP